MSFEKKRTNSRETFLEESESHKKRKKEIEIKFKNLEEKESKWKELETIGEQRYQLKPEKINLDVGGERFATLKSALYNQTVSDYFWFLVRSDWKEGEDGTFFIERNPKHFPVIFRYIRDGEFHLRTMNEEEKEELKSDLRYFRISIPDEFEELKESEESEGKDSNSELVVFSKTDEKIEMELEELNNKFKLWIEMEALMKKEAEKSSSKVVLDIGGKKFSASKEVLTSQPNSYFSAMFRSGNWKPDKDGSYFIDKDSNRFAAVLEYLRTGKFDVGSESKESLKSDLDFFQIQVPAEVWGIPDGLSNLLTDDHYNVIMEKWIGGKKKIGELLWRGSRDGVNAHVFHTLCDKKGPTLVVIQSLEGWIFGGYAAAFWDSSRTHSKSWIYEPNSFIFTLLNPHNIQPTKFVCSDPQRAQYGNLRYGPSFGRGDIMIGPESYTTFPDSYKDTTGKGRLIFTGERTFHIKEVEVFQIIE